MKKLVAECNGAFALVFAGTGAIVINDVSGGCVREEGCCSIPKAETAI